ncbi:MAG: T9SS type A sorting domain-containing protein [Saprospiraceae bacterium]|nr:T9SS type A sorting domain-containing protein [Saprospiraceae bacterium]
MIRPRQKTPIVPAPIFTNTGIAHLRCNAAGHGILYCPTILILNQCHIKKLTLIISFIFCNGFMANAQLTQSLPQVGDAFYRCAHLEKIEKFMAEPTSPQFWDFGFLKTYYSVNEEFKPAKAGRHADDFPRATLVWAKSNNEEEYLYVKDGGLYSMGRVLEVPYRKSRKEVFLYSPARRLMVTNRRKGSTYENDYNLTIIIDREDIASVFNFVPTGFDSMLIELSYAENATVINEGFISYDNNSIPVQQHEVSIRQGIKSRIKKSGQAWQVYERLNSNALPQELATLLKFQRYQRVDFISANYKGVLLSYEILNNNINRIDYQSREPGPYALQLDYTENGITAHPNPSFGQVIFDLFNYPYDEYKLEVYNLVGKRIYSRNFSVKDGRLLLADLSQLKRGTYLYSIFDSQGRKLTTKRVSLISI